MRRLSGALVQEVKERIELGHKQTTRGQGGCYAVKQLEMAELVLETSQPPLRRSKRRVLLQAGRQSDIR